MNIADHPVLRDHSNENLTDALAQLGDQARQYGHEPPDPAVFAPPGTREQLDHAREWWPDDAPTQLSWAACLGGSLAMYGTPNPGTLMAHLEGQARRVTAWLEGEGRDTDRPNESKADRMRRMNRERVAAHREAKTAEGPTDRQVAWGAVVEARRARSVAKAQHDKDVREAYDLMMERSELRSRIMAEHDEKVQAAEAAHKETLD